MSARGPILAVLALAVSSPAVGQYSGRFGCTGDCSGHEAGYEWAVEQGITDPRECRGRSQSFIEGCQDRALQLLEQSITPDTPVAVPDRSGRPPDMPPGEVLYRCESPGLIMYVRDPRPGCVVVAVGGQE